MEFEIYRGAAREWRWRLRASNGKIVADSGEGYNNQADCEAGLILVAGTTAQTKVSIEDGTAATILGMGAKTTVGHLMLKHRG